MGVDIYGCSFTRERRAKHDLMEEIGLKAYYDLPQEERPFDTSAPGAYFQRSYVSWRPIADMICDLFPDIAVRCRYWRSSDGDGLNGHYALRLADEIDRALKDGTITDWLAYRAIDMRGQESPEEGVVEHVKAFADFCRHSGGFEIH